MTPFLYERASNVGAALAAGARALPAARPGNPGRRLRSDPQHGDGGRQI